MDTASILIWLTSIGAAVESGRQLYNRVFRPLQEWIVGLSEKLDSLDQIKKQLDPNGGSSLRDAIDRIESRMIISDQRYRLLTMDSPFGIFETDGNGDYIRVNRTLCRWTERSEDEVLGRGWINTLAPASRDKFMDEWIWAIKDKREFSHRFTIQNYDKSFSLEVHCAAFPMFDTKGVCSGWLGIISKDKQ